jgi:GlcNAc-PI de-N-acetylase
MMDDGPGSARCLLGVFAHPDDEVFCAGGTMARAAEAGAEVMIVSATRDFQADHGGVPRAARRPRPGPAAVPRRFPAPAHLHGRQPPGEGAASPVADGLPAVQ